MIRSGDCQYKDVETHIILIGDFISDVLHKPDNGESEYGKRLQRILNSCELKNIRNNATCIIDKPESLIDLVITWLLINTHNSGFADLGICSLLSDSFSSPFKRFKPY